MGVCAGALQNTRVGAGTGTGAGAAGIMMTVDVMIYQLFPSSLIFPKYLP